MKMNRSRSSHSLENGIDDIQSSSSGSTEFTSDDETNSNSLYDAFLRLRKNKVDNKPSSSNQDRNDYVLYPRNMLQESTSRQNLGRNNQNQLTNNQLAYVSPLEPSTSYFDNDQSNLSTNDSLISSRIPDIVPDPASLSLSPSQSFDHRCNNRRIGCQSEHYRATLNSLSRDITSNFDADEEDNADTFGPIDSRLESNVQAIGGPNRERMQTFAAREFCARLVESRSIFEAIILVEQNREMIDELTRIVTRDAPAYRNYELSNYQIDYSVKESFNPHFWHDREPIVTTADGNCQYHAVSISLTGSEIYTQEVRLATAVAVIDNREWFDSMLKLIDRGSVLDLVHTIAKSFSWGDETTLKAIAVAIKRRIFLYTCNIGKKDYEVVKSLTKEELLDAFREKKYRGGTGIHAYADPLTYVPPNNYIMLFHKSEHFIAVLPTTRQPTMFEPYNPIVPVFT